MGGTRQIGRVEFEENGRPCQVILYADGTYQTDCSEVRAGLFAAYADSDVLDYRGPQDGFPGYTPLYKFAKRVRGKMYFLFPDDPPGTVY